MNLNKECKNLSYTVFITGIVGTFVFLCMYIMFNFLSVFEFTVALFAMIILTTIMFALPTYSGMYHD